MIAISGVSLKQAALADVVGTALHAFRLSGLHTTGPAALSIADVGYVIETGRILMSATGSELLMDEQVKHAYLGM